MTPEEACEAVALTIGKDTLDLFEQVIEQAEHYKEHRRPPKEGAIDLPGFVRWMWQHLPMGWSSLPVRMPVDLLTAWVRGYIPEAGWDKRPISPQPDLRCESCYLVHPNRDKHGEWGGPDVCAACGGRDFSGQQFFDMRLFSRDGGCTTFAADAWCRGSV
jgi:hypothetical protein